MAYPFLIITNERFPRILATRRPEICTGGERIYGAFLPEAMVRRLLDILGKTFKLRPCELDIDGSFDAPCPEYFLHRCLAPCVAKLCDQRAYRDAVNNVHLLLANRAADLIADLQADIERFSDELEFEKASQTHEILKIVQDISTNSKWNIHAAEFTDVITAKCSEDAISVHLNSLRRGKSVGGQHRIFPKNAETPDESRAIEKFIADSYNFYAPRKIFVSHDFSARKTLEKSLAQRFQRKIQISAETVENLPPTVSASRRHAEFLLSGLLPTRAPDADKIAAELQKIFQFSSAPSVLECYDTAHLGGKSIVTARVVGRRGNISSEDDFVWQFENLSETGALAEALRQRFKLLPESENLPEVILLDGGKPQMSAAQKVFDEFGINSVQLIAAVKPPAQHAKISHFLSTQSREKITFDASSAAMNYLQKLRDAAHKLSNETHRRQHSLASIFYENRSADAPQILYLLVPQRFAAPHGAAEHLSPLRAFDNYGELLLKTKSVTDEEGKKYKRRSRWSRLKDE